MPKITIRHGKLKDAPPPPWAKPAKPTNKDAARKRAKEQDDFERDKSKRGAKEEYTDPALLYPIPKPGEDEDDMQDFFVAPKPPREMPPKMLKKEDHMPDDAVTTEHQFPEKEEWKSMFGVDPRQKNDPWQKPILMDPAPRQAAKAPYRGTKDIPNAEMPNRLTSRLAEIQMAVEQYQPLDFEKLMKELTQWYIQKGKDYEIFPFHVLVCCDYLWLAQGKRRTGKTTLWKTVVPQISCMYPVCVHFELRRGRGSLNRAM